MNSAARRLRSFAGVGVVAIGSLLLPVAAHTQTPSSGQTVQPGAPAAQPAQPTERVTFQQAIDRAVANNTSIAIATAGILRAEGLLRQARAATLLQVNGSAVLSTLNRVVEFGGQTVVPGSQISAALGIDMPIVAAAAWARRAQAQDQARIAGLSSTDVRRQISVSTADAYLTVLAQHRIVDANARARDVAKAHFDLATQLEQRGSGSRLNALRAQQQWSTDETLLESSRLALYRAQEALGVLMVAAGPVDAGEEPNFALPADAVANPAAAGSLDQLLQFRTDLRLFSAQSQAAERVVRDSSKDWWPTLDALFQPATVYPKSVFTPSTTWQLLFRGTIPVFDSGQRAGLRVERQSALDIARATLTGAETQATSDVRAAREAVASGERGLSAARAAADQAQQVVNITNIAFRAGAATNIEVIDAERSARDADTAVAAAEDALRRARLELLQALGRFP